MSATSELRFGLFEATAVVVMVLQIGVFARIWSESGLGEATDTLPFLFLATALLLRRQRRLELQPPNAGVAGWLAASRTAALALLALGTLGLGYKSLVPGVSPDPALIMGSVFVLMWAVIALKGAGIGKLKPGSAMGLCVPWTLQSRLAWDRAHRALGRVLFWGGLAGLGTCLLMPPLASAALWLSTVGLAVTAALIEGRQSWRLDADRRPA